MNQSSAMPKENPPTLVVGSSQGMKERGFSLGCQPKDGLLGLSDKSSDKYYDIIEYSSKLTKKEIKEYKLDPIE